MGIGSEIYMLNLNSAKVNLGRRRKLAFRVSSKTDTIFARFCRRLMAVSQELGLGAGMRAIYLTGQARIFPLEG